MALVNWNPVTAANFSESNALRLAAQQQLASGIKGFGDTATAFNDATGKANTDILLNSLVGQRTPEAAMAAIEAAKAQAGGMYNNYDQAAFRSAAEALPKSAADAQELDLQIADKPYLQAAALAYSRGDREAVGNFAKEVRSNAGRAELSKLIGDSHTMAVQDAGVVNAEKTLTANIKDNQAKNDIAWYNAKTQRYEAGKKSGDNRFLTMLGGIRQQFKTAADKASVAAVTKTQNTPESNLAYQNAMNGTDGDRIRTWGNVSGKHVDKVLTANVPAYAAAGSGLRAKVLDHIWAANTAQTADGMFGGLFQSDLSDEQIKTIGATALADFAANDKVNLTMEQERIIENGVAKIQLEGLRDGHLVTDAEAREMLIPTLNEQPAAGTPPPKPKEDPKAAAQYLKDKAELAAREAKRQAALAAGKGSPKPVKGGVVLPSRHPVGINAPKDPTQGSSPTAQAIISGVKSASKAIADTSKAKPNTEMLQGGGYDFLDRSVVPVNTDGLTTVAKGVGKLATTSVPEAILAIDAYNAKPVNTPIPTKPIDVPKADAKVVAAVKTAPSDISAVTNVFAQVAAAQAKAKVPTPVTPAVIKTTVRQDVKGTTPIAKSVSVTPPPVVKPVETNQAGIEQALPPDLVREAPAATVLKSSVKQTKTGSVPIATTAKTGTWETMFKQIANKANEVISGKGWSNDPKNQEQYENGLVVGNDTQQPSSKYDISIITTLNKGDVVGDFSGGYGVEITVKGGDTYRIPVSYDEIASHTGTNKEGILSTSSRDERANAEVRRRVYRTALDKFNTQMANSKSK